MADFPPNGLDWADGLGGNPGTPTPDGAREVRGGNGDEATWFEEDPGSPDIERAEQCTIKHSFSCDYEITGLTILNAVGRGSIFTDSYGNVTRVLSSNLTRERGNKAKLSIISESISFDTPPDDFQVHTTELNPDMTKHPKYIPIFGDGISKNPYNENSLGNKIDTKLLSGKEIGELCDKAVSSSGIGQKNETLSGLNSTTVTGNYTDPKTGVSKTILSLAMDLYQRYLRKEQDWYFVGFTVVWSLYYWFPQAINPGGYIEDPVTQGGLPEYFWVDESGDNIFTSAGHEVNPAIWDGGISWLRLSDTQEYSRTWFKVTRTWMGAPLGHWDKAIYPQAA